MSTQTSQVLRAEIKAWERDFKAKTGSQPTVNDIKDNPSIAAKYKLYKKLSKSKEPQPGSLLLRRPQTPPHLAQTSTSYNPFSPQKDKTRRPPPNPFGSPIKSSLSQFPRFESPPPETPSVSRARKRLRGDSVSPSPDKRRRVSSSQLPSLPFAGFGPPEVDNDEELEQPTASTSFLDDSPVKVSRGSKSFQSLFQDASKIRFPQTDPFSDQDNDSDTPSDPMFRAQKRLHEIAKHAPRKPTAWRPSMLVHDHSSDGGALDTAERTSTPDSSTATESDQATTLIPPSPPAEGSFQSNAAKGRKNTTTRGKSGKKKVAAGDDDDSDSPPREVRIKVLNRYGGVPKVGSEDGDTLFETLHTETAAWEGGIPESTDLEVDLPDTLLEVLNITGPSRPFDDREEKDAVNRLLYQHTRVHYDSTKGGEIWHVGEYEGENDDLAERGKRADDDDDEWDTEPVPWEKAEL